MYVLLLLICYARKQTGNSVGPQTLGCDSQRRWDGNFSSALPIQIMKSKSTSHIHAIESPELRFLFSYPQFPRRKLLLFLSFFFRPRALCPCLRLQAETCDTQYNLTTKYLSFALLSGHPPVTNPFKKISATRAQASFSFRKKIAMKGLGKLGISLTVVFAVCLIALIVDVLYVLWRRRSFRRRGRAVEYPEEQAYSPSKELLYFFCWKRQTCVEPGTVQRPGNDELARWEKLYGPSRVLFTIKEEEREEDEADHNRCPRESNVRETRVCLEDAVVVVPAEVDDATPFSTPCASPPYYTPSPSPSRGTEDIQ